MRVIFSMLMAAFAAIPVHAQSLELVPSTLIVPAKYQKFFDSVHTVNLPKGFTATVFYTGTLSSPRFMDFSPSGTLCIADQSLSTVIALLGHDSLGAADSAITIATGTNNAHSIAFHNGSLFAASPNHVWRYDNPSASGVYGTNQLFIDTLGSAPEGPTNHTTRTLLFDDPSNSLFVSVGSACNACRETETDSERGTILRFNSDGSGRKIYATGLRNAVGLAMDSSHKLWATVAERNSQGEDVPGDLVTAIDSGRFYGWPIAFGDHQWDNFSADSEYHALLPLTLADSIAVQNMRVPDATQPAHSTPLGIAYNQDTSLPPLYNNSFFVAVHGSYQGADGRLVANGSKIVLLQNSKGVWSSTNFCTGFLTDSINYTRWARPCGIILDHKGNIYFSSDNNVPHAPPAIFRISYDPNAAVSFANNNPTSVDVFQQGDHAELRLNNIVDINPSIILYDALGRKQLLKIADETSSSDAHVYQIDLTSLNRGIYFLVVKTTEGQFVRKLLR
jgi:glucose/arabinose dehydrogenase